MTNCSLLQKRKQNSAMKKNLIHALYLVAYILAYGFWFLMSLLPLRVLYVVSDFLKTCF